MKKKFLAFLGLSILLTIFLVGCVDPMGDALREDNASNIQSARPVVVAENFQMNKNSAATDSTFANETIAYEADNLVLKVNTDAILTATKAKLLPEDLKDRDGVDFDNGDYAVTATWTLRKDGGLFYKGEKFYSTTRANVYTISPKSSTELDGYYTDGDDKRTSAEIEAAKKAAWVGTWYVQASVTFTAPSAANGNTVANKVPSEPVKSDWFTITIQ